MIMVNTLGYGTPDGPRGAMGATMIPTFAKALVEEVLPQVEKQYRVTKDRTQRAIAGLSMGGAESLYTGLHNSDKFAYIGSFSGAFVMWPRANPPAPIRKAGADAAAPMEAADFDKNFPGLDAKAASRLKLIWIACGNDDGLMAVNRQFKTWLKSKDIAFTDLEIPGLRARLAAVAPQPRGARPVTLPSPNTGRIQMKNVTRCVCGGYYLSAQAPSAQPGTPPPPAPQAQPGRGGRGPQPPRSFPGVAARSPRDLPHLRAQGRGGAARRRRHPRQRPGART